MVVRAKEGRHRYIAFIVSPPVPKSRLLAALEGAREGKGLRLVLYDGGRGLVQCGHTAKDEAVAFLSRLEVGTSRLRTVGTSGTIRKARQKYFSRKGSRIS